ncbi:MAG: hypothetical protein ACYC0B_01650 [Gemmatimonadaceae bacterium]
MSSDPSVERRAARRPFALILVAVLAAASVFLLPAVDAVLPGGSLAWQVVALAVAVGAAAWGYRITRAPALLAAGARRRARLLAGVAVLLVLLWLSGVFILWLIWPR